jgi:pyruvate/2-oxoglutarate dehydrogenase complex dihydrolipoamide dehydrogenase (E3) component
LFEKEKELGGALHYAAAPPFKADMKRYLEWMIEKTHLAPIDVRLSTEATAHNIREANPDVLILAVGADPYIPDIPGSGQQNVTWAGDVIMGKADTGDTVVVAGAGLTGCETALYLAQKGKKVTVIDMITELEIAQDGSSLGKISLMGLLEQHGVEFKTEVKLERITENGIKIMDRGWNRFNIDADTIVLSLGSKARVDTIAALDGLVRDVYVIGDCAKPRDLKAAIHDGFNVAAEI